MLFTLKTSITISLACLISFIGSLPAYAGGLNSDAITFFEKPFTYEAFDGVFELNTNVAVGYQSQNNGNSKFDTHELVTLYGFYKQLDNGTETSITYFSDYANERNDAYEDLIRISAKDQWGEVIVGDVSSLIFERTNRFNGDNLIPNISNDQFSLPLDNYGVFYQWQTPATQWMIAVDKDANIEVGTRYYKPINGVEYVLSAHANHVENDRGDAQGVNASDSIALTAQAQRGRWIVDTQLLSEKLSLLSGNSITLKGFSGGIHYKGNRWQVSMNATERENELDDTERRIGIDAQYDVARGLSLNLGTNVFNTELLPNKLRSHAVSIQYQY